MATKTGIEWTDATWNPIRVRVRENAADIARAKGYTSLVQIAEKMAGRVGSHCEPVSPGCTRCYAGSNNHRCLPGNGTGLPYDRRSRDLVDAFVDEKALLLPLKWKPVLTGIRDGEGILCRKEHKDGTVTVTRKRPRRIFVENQSDLFAEWVTDEMLDRVFAIMALCPQHTFQVLTKRPERMLEYCSDSRAPFRIARQMDAILVAEEAARAPYEIRQWPGDAHYFVDNTGKVLTTHGSGRCVWCGGAIEAVHQDARFCGTPCRSASHYAKTQGRNPEPAGATMREVAREIGDQGHCRVWIVDAKRAKRELVHRMVLETFVGPGGEYNQSLHMDGNPQNCHIANLRWGTQEENWSDRLRHGRHRSYSKLTENDVAELRALAASGMSAIALASRFNVSDTQVRNILNGHQWSVSPTIPWPLPNVHKGVSVENQKAADERIPLLLQTPAAVRFLSCEPLLGPVDLNAIGIPLAGHRATCSAFGGYHVNTEVRTLDWVICGGESGPGARPMHPDWARSLRDQCQVAGVPFFFKQWGEHWPISQMPDGWLDKEENRKHIGKGQVLQLDGSIEFAFPPGAMTCYPVGKHVAGALLDGREWKEFPGAK